MSNPPAPRIDAIVAREAPIAVVFRRGPSRLTQLLTWNLETDEVSPGQWIRANVYTRRFDLSPDGRYLVGCFTDYSQWRKNRADADGSPSSHNWTAVSRPPYFTAIALWFSFGGGNWLSNRHLMLSSGIDFSPEQQAPPKSIKVTQRRWGSYEAIWEDRLEASGWLATSLFKTKMGRTKRPISDTLSDLKTLLFDGSIESVGAMKRLFDAVLPRWEMTQRGHREKSFLGGTLRHATWLEPSERWGMPSELWELCDRDGKVVREWRPKPFQPQFLDVDHRGRVLFGDKGCLWAWQDFPAGAPTMVADLSQNKFENVAPPAWALEW